ncbi:MAG: histidine kinase dimerization/phospho-acceptor domain-containing protein [Candidatus Angelobacter sp.]
MKVILFGATGMVGQGVLRECLLDPEVEQVLTIGRAATGQQHAKLQEITATDLFDLSAIEGRLSGFDACFFCLGVSAAGMNEQDYRRVTYELERRVQDRTQQLVAANHELEAFSYSVSHDLRGPLQTINGFVHMLSADYDSKLDERGRDYLQQLRSSSRRMAELIEDLLNLSRVSTTAMHGEKVDLSALAKSIAHNFQSREPARNVEFVIASCNPAEGDSRLLQIAMENLLNNAWKYTSGRPQARIEFGCQKRPAGSVYFVRDNGAGFDGRQAGRLFKPFQRLHSENDFPGTGIGLATLQRIVAAPWRRGLGRIRDRTWSNVLFHSACGECCDRSTQAGVKKKTARINVTISAIAI